jgi:hydrogenase-1 operon protein HyaE
MSEATDDPASLDAVDALEALARSPGCEVLRKSRLAGFVAESRHALVFLTGDARNRAEGLDVAVVVRELLHKYAGRLRVGIIDRRDETIAMPSLGVVVLPAVVFARHGQLVEVIARMRDWSAYVAACERLFEEDRA